MPGKGVADAGQVAGHHFRPGHLSLGEPGAVQGLSGDQPFATHSPPGKEQTVEVMEAAAAVIAVVEDAQKVGHIGDVARLFPDFPGRADHRRLAHVAGAAGESPLAVVRPTDEEQTVILIKEGRVHHSEGRLVVEIVEEERLQRGPVVAACQPGQLRRQSNNAVIAFDLIGIVRIV